MGILFDSDKLGIALALLVFLIMILIGLHGSVSPAVVIGRACVGFTVAYFLGFTLSRLITSALVTTMATERARKLVQREKRRKQTEQEGAETESKEGSS